MGKTKTNPFRILGWCISNPVSLKKVIGIENKQLILWMVAKSCIPKRMVETKYPLVTNITMENHHFQWVNALEMAHFQ